MVQPSDWSSTASTNTFRVFSTYNLIRKHNSSWIGVHVLKITVFSVITNSIIATGHFADASVALNSSSKLQTNLSASVCGTRTHQCHVSVVVLDRPDLSCFLQSLRASCWLLARRTVLAQMLIYWLLNEARSGVTAHSISSVWFWVKSWKINKCICMSSWHMLFKSLKLSAGVWWVLVFSDSSAQIFESSWSPLKLDSGKVLAIKQHEESQQWPWIRAECVCLQYCLRKTICT